MQRAFKKPDTKGDDGRIGGLTLEQTELYESWMDYYSKQNKKEYPPELWGLHLTILLILLYDKLSIYHLTIENCKDFIARVGAKQPPQGTLHTNKYRYAAQNIVNETGGRNSKEYSKHKYSQDVVGITEDGESQIED